MSVMSPQRSSVSARLAEMSPRELARITGICGIITFLQGLHMASPVLDGRRDTDGDPDPAIAAS